VPDLAAGEGRDGPLAVGLPHVDSPPGRARPGAAHPPDRLLLRYGDGRPITSRLYDHLWTRLGRILPWVATQRISTHWIRHTILTS